MDEDLTMRQMQSLVAKNLTENEGVLEEAEYIVKSEDEQPSQKTESKLSDDIAKWAIEHNISRSAYEHLLRILRERLPNITNMLYDNQNGSNQPMFVKQESYQHATLETPFPPATTTTTTNDANNSHQMASLVNEVSALRRCIEELRNIGWENQQKLVKQEGILQQLTKHLPQETSHIKIFPFSSIGHLKYIEENVDNYVKSELISYIKYELGKRDLSKSLSIIFTDDLLLEVNWDGVKQKVALKKFKFFKLFVYEAIKTLESTFGEFEDQMRKGIKYAKNKIYKKKSVTVLQ